ncbi:hypothetical protein GCM10027037_22770 [Mucilaginibacter koreensis]
MGAIKFNSLNNMYWYCVASNCTVAHNIYTKVQLFLAVECHKKMPDLTVKIVYVGNRRLFNKKAQ